MIPVRPQSEWQDGMQGLFALDEKTYRNASGASQSIVKCMAPTPAHCLIAQKSAKEPTKAMLVGTELHTLMLEPHNYGEGLSHWIRPETYPAPDSHKDVLAGKINAGAPLPWSGNAKVCKDWTIDKLKEKSLPIFTKEDIGNIQGMMTALKDHEQAGPALSNGASEVAAFYQEPETGLLLKARIDKICDADEGVIVADVKKCQEATDWPYQGYGQGAHIQAFSNLFILRGLGINALRFVFFAVEEKPPHDIVLWEASEQFLDHGEKWFRYYLNQYAECVKSGVWPGSKPDIQFATPPRYATLPPIIN